MNRFNAIIKASDELNIPLRLRSSDDTGETYTIEGVTDSQEKEIENKATEILTRYTNDKYKRDRESLYPTKDDLIVALWEKVVEGRSESADALEVKRQSVKSSIPKGA